MKTKIGSWKDLKVGDVWLGLSVCYINANASYESMPVVKGAVGLSGGYVVAMYDCQIDALIEAGSDTVERKPEKEVLSAQAILIGEALRKGMAIGRAQERGEQVAAKGVYKVTIEPL